LPLNLTNEPLPATAPLAEAYISAEFGVLLLCVIDDEVIAEPLAKINNPDELETVPVGEARIVTPNAIVP
jgi:hypothetical protein